MTVLTPARSSTTYGSAVVSPHELATAAGLEIMAAGGNSVDAAIATNAVQGVVAPETCGIGGDLFALIHRPGLATPTYLNASGRAGSGASAAALREAGHDVMPLFHPAAITVPGCVDGWLALHERYGTRPFADVLEPAIRLAAGGFPASVELADSFTRRADELANVASARAMYPEGRNPVPGARIVRLDLARTLRTVAAGDRAGFYEGEFGAALTEATGGTITATDCSRPLADWMDPLGRHVFGLTAWTSPPNTQGYLTLATARTFELTDPPIDPDNPDFWHLLIEAYRSSSWERDDLVADPDTAPLAPEDLVAEQRLAARAGAIDPASTGVWPAHPRASGGTAYMCAIDDDGLAISLIQSNFHGIGAGIGAGDTGVLLHNRGGGFNLRPGHANELTPGRRPLHTLAPTLWTEGEDLRLLLGTRGGHQQPQLLATAAALHLYAGLEPADAQAYPRWTTEHLDGDRSDVQLEGRVPNVVAAELAERGHIVSIGPDWPAANGPISMIAVRADGLRTAAADPRVDTALAAAR